MPGKRQMVYKERMKKLRKSFKPKKHNEDDWTKEDKIKELKSRINLCEYDLKNFPKNNLIKHKIAMMQEQLDALEKEDEKEEEEDVDNKE
jgi:hypothetical protein